MGLTRSWRTLSEAVAAIVVLTACAVFLVVALAPPPENPKPAGAELVRRLPVPPSLVLLGDSAFEGRTTAPVAVIEYSDFECGACSRFATDALHRVENAYTEPGKVLFAFRHLPMVTEHKSALRAALIAECAGQQGRFWRMHDLLFRNTRRLDDSVLLQLTSSLEMDRGRFELCLKDKTMREKVARDVAAATDIGVFDVPTFLIGSLRGDRRVQVTARLSGPVSFQDLQAEIDRLLRASKSSSQ